jgi:hypothetical protein
MSNEDRKFSQVSRSARAGRCALSAIEPPVRLWSPLAS